MALGCKPEITVRQPERILEQMECVDSSNASRNPLGDFATSTKSNSICTRQQDSNAHVVEQSRESGTM
jgi:hypothetical protein